jgi:hypothetical protein
MTSYKVFLEKEKFNNNSRNLRVTKVKETNYGFIIHLFSNYVCLYYKYVSLGKNGTAKIKTIVDRNYHSKYQHTTYEDKFGKQITLKEFKQLNK